MTDPLPEHLQAITLETFKCLSPATKRLVESRNGLEPQSAKKGSTMKTKKKGGALAVEVDDVPLDFVPEVWSQIPPEKGLSFLPEKGCYRKTFPACLARKIKGSAKKKTYPAVEAEYSDKFGATYAVLLTLNYEDRPSWDLNRNDTTQALVSVIVTGVTMKEVMKGQPGERFIKALEATETKAPYVSHKVTLHELQQAVSVKSKARAFDMNLKDPKIVWFQLSSDKNSNRYNLDDRKDPQWPEFAVRKQSGDSATLVPAQRSITPENSESEDDEENDEREDDDGGWLLKAST